MTPAPKRLLVVDAEPRMRRVVQLGLAAHSYEVVVAESGAEALRLARGHAPLDPSVGEAPDLILLDPALPDMPCLSLLRKLREESQIPIIIFATPDDEAAKLEALDLGADDFVTTPFDMADLVSRVAAALRPPARVAEFQPEGVTVDVPRHAVRRDGVEVTLTACEQGVLGALMAKAGGVVSQSTLLRVVAGDELGPDVRWLRAKVAGLREKLERDPSRPRLITTEPGVGYRLRTPDA